MLPVLLVLRRCVVFVAFVVATKTLNFCFYFTAAAAALRFATHILAKNKKVVCVFVNIHILMTRTFLVQYLNIYIYVCVLSYIYKYVAAFKIILLTVAKKNNTNIQQQKNNKKRTLRRRSTHIQT